MDRLIVVSFMPFFIHSTKINLGDMTVSETIFIERLPLDAALCTLVGWGPLVKCNGKLE